LKPTVTNFNSQSRTVLISCYELGQQPLGLVGMAAALQGVGIAPALIDLAVEPMDEAKVSTAVLVGISVPMHTALRLGVETARRVRLLNATCHICFYGLYAGLNRDYLLQHLADSCLGGECEEPFCELAVSLDQTTEGTNSGGGRHGLPGLDRYVKLEHQGRLKKVGHVATTRGCKHLCLHCPIPPIYHGKFYVNSAAQVLDEVRQLVGLGAEHITFGDPDFLNGPSHADRVTEALHEQFPAVTFDYTAKIEHLLKYRELVGSFKARGCLFVVSAVESLNDQVLSNLVKGHTRQDILDVFDFFEEAGMTLRPSLVPFTPWETLDSYLDLLEVVAQRGLVDQLDPIHYTIRLLIPPGSSLLSSAAMQGYLLDLDASSFSYRWRHPDPRMDELQAVLSKLVEAATAVDEDPACTFDRIRQTALIARFGDLADQPISQPRLDIAKPRSPRLTETWFCCAEPTEIQLASIRADSGNADERACCQSEAPIL
jgi:radical SAM superfamily enzyme YgiQ (UPF0313 family)